MRIICLGFHQQNDIHAREKSKIELLGGLCHTMVDIRSSVSNMMESLNWPKLESRQRVSRLQTVNKGVNKLPVYLYHPTFYPHNIQLDLIFQIFYASEFMHIPVIISNPFFPRTIVEWINLSFFSD